MRNFLRIAERVDTLPVLNALACHPDLWDENTLRTKHPQTAHSQVSDIWVWFNDIRPEALAAAIDDKDVVPYRAWSVIPQFFRELPATSLWASHPSWKMFTKRTPRSIIRRASRQALPKEGLSGSQP